MIPQVNDLVRILPLISTKESRTFHNKIGVVVRVVSINNIYVKVDDEYYRWFYHYELEIIYEA